MRKTTPTQFGLAGAAQVALVIRTVTEKGQTQITRHHMVTSLPGQPARCRQVAGGAANGASKATVTNDST